MTEGRRTLSFPCNPPRPPAYSTNTHEIKTTASPHYQMQPLRSVKSNTFFLQGIAVHNKSFLNERLFIIISQSATTTEILNETEIYFLISQLLLSLHPPKDYRTLCIYIIRQYKNFQSRDILEHTENFSPNAAILNLWRKTVNSTVINTSLSNSKWR